MFLSWVAKCELLSPSADAYVLKRFPEKSQRGVSAMIVNSVTAESAGGRIADMLPTEKHLRWTMEGIGHAFALGMEDSDVIADAIKIYEQWLGITKPQQAQDQQNQIKQKLTSSSSSKTRNKPPAVERGDQSFIQDMLGHLTILFDERSDISRQELFAKHVSLCCKALDIFDAVAKKQGAQISSQTWDRMMRLLLGSADAVLHGSRNSLGASLCDRFIRILFEVYLRSLAFCGPKGELWNLLQKFCRRWIHRNVVVEQWNAMTLALTRVVIKQIQLNSKGCDVEIFWTDRVVSKISLDASLVSYAWYRFLRVVGHPTAMTDPDVYLTAIKGINALTEEFMSVERLPQLDANQLKSRDKSETRVRSPPDVNTILRIVGPWLFDACLNRKSRFNSCRSEALRSLGRLVCHFHGGRSKRIHWPYGIRCLLALQYALLDDDERISSSAIYNWSRVFGLFGTETLRGIGVISGDFHKAVERVLRMEHSRSDIGGVPSIWLRRACIDACASLLTLHSHVPRQLIKEAENAVVMPTMAGFSGLLSSLPKFSTSNVIGLLINGLKTENDPTNQQMMMWVLTVAAQQEACFWTSGLVSSRNSQVPFTILTICSVFGKISSTRFKAPVMFTAFECLRHLALVSEPLCAHSPSSVFHLMNAVCDFVSTNLTLLASGKAPFYLDDLLADAFNCILEWIVASPLLMSQPGIVSKVVNVVVEASEENVSSMFMKESSARAAKRLLNALMKRHIADLNPDLTEKVILSEHCHTNQLEAHCRFFAVDKRAIVGVIEKHQFSSESSEVIMVVRDSFGRYAWRAKPRYRFESRAAVLEGFDLINDRNLALKEIESMDDADMEWLDNGNPPPEEVDLKHPDPLLDAIRSSRSQLTSWSLKVDGVEKEASGNCVQANEGNTGMSLAIERKIATGSSGTPNELQDPLFVELLSRQSREEEEERARRQQSGSSDRTVLTGGLCKKPALSQLCHATAFSSELSRRLMTELGFLSIQNWGAVFPLNNMSPTDHLLSDLEKLDRLADRECYEIGVAYATCRGSCGGSDVIQVPAGCQLRETSRDFQLFLASVGEFVDMKLHGGYKGCLASEDLEGNLLYYDQYDCEVCFYVPTMPLWNPDKKNQVDGLKLLSRAQVLIVWNECQQKYRPNTLLWQTQYRLPAPTSQVYIIIDPLGNDLFCVRICLEGSLLFKKQESATESPSFADQEQVFCARLLGPLQDGMVVTGAWLGPLVRQTALNAASLYRAFCRLQQERGVRSAKATPRVSERPDKCREDAILKVIDAHLNPMLPGEFYAQFFSVSRQSSREESDVSIS